MQLLKDILFWSAFTLIIGWIAVFICAISSHRRGTMPRFFSGGRSYHIWRAKRRLKWSQKLILIPVGCILLPVFALCFLIVMPPMYIIEKWIFKE